MDMALFLSSHSSPNSLPNSAYLPNATTPAISRRSNGLSALTLVPSSKPSPHVSFGLSQTTPKLYSRQGNISPKNDSFKLYAQDRRSIGGSEDEPKALDTVMKLYTALKNRNSKGVSDIIAEECKCMCNFISLSPLQGKKQVVQFLSTLMGTMGKSMHFIIEPTFHEGLVVGVQWNLQWKGYPMPLGKGYAIYTIQKYEGRVLISNMQMSMEPLLKSDLLRLRLIKFMAPILDRLPFHDTKKPE
ncbi:hypothetical protein AMTRI_Chr10g229990 [Amborella trichopoda]|uniref:uncharacterized protein LOC18446670 isoform X1 n=1 Tax=Amborella trichopoda TaxID=13333 RepID=UPI0005D33064|nr:uncharacterized protein LOC18446670 isoform X1 [Amborella trichopoda]|eukprot:XP_011627975.1 uncharacterized protein LOC18446670 isoform X1 [Amborella trichopoda]